MSEPVATIPDGEQADAQTPQNIPTTNGASTDIEMKEEPTDAPTDVPHLDTSTTPAGVPTTPLPSASASAGIGTTSTPPPPSVTPVPAPSTGAAPAASHHPARTGSPRPSAPPAAFPKEPNSHGSPTRVYLNQHVTPHLLEGVKQLALVEPEKPLKWLADYLAQKSKEIEGA